MSTPWPDPALLTGHLAPRSLVEYARDAAAYVRFCGPDAEALDATALARWRTHLAQATTLSPHTINRMLAAVKRLLREGTYRQITRHFARRVRSLTSGSWLLRPPVAAAARRRAARLGKALGAGPTVCGDATVHES